MRKYGMLQINDISMNTFRKPSHFGNKFSDRNAEHSNEPHKTTCDGCHAMCEVPFRPNGKKPVYCRNCFKGKETTTSFVGQPFTKEPQGSGDLQKQFVALSAKIDKLIAVIEEQTRVLSKGR